MTPYPEAQTPGDERSRGAITPPAPLPGPNTALHERAIAALHQYLLTRHCQDGALIGPDPGIRFNYRLGRFLKSYMRRMRWSDDLYYLQAQGYWTLANWELFRATGDPLFADTAVRCSEETLARQRADGAWEYPNPEWSGRIATGEGIWASLGLLETYRETRDAKFLAGVLLWHRFLERSIGYQAVLGGLAVNYFAGRGDAAVPNNTACTLRFLAELAEASEEEHYATRCSAMLTFLRAAQRPGGEFPYALSGVGEPAKDHFQCFQYNGFQCLELFRYAELTADDPAAELAVAVLPFLARGINAEGRPRYQCDQPYPAVTYHAGVLAAAFSLAARRGFGAYADLAARAYGYVLRLQRPDGSFPHSFRDYRVVRDERAYPRYLAMVLYHLILGGRRPPEAASAQAG